MNTRHTAYIVVAAAVSALVLAPWRGAALPPAPDLDPIPVQGRLSPDGRFDETLVVKAVTVAEAGRLILTGVLDGTATRRDGAQTPVRGQPFTAPAVPVDTEQTWTSSWSKWPRSPSPRWDGRSRSPRSPSTSRPSPMRASCSRRS
jgi:hypothetical protein